MLRATLCLTIYIYMFNAWSFLHSPQMLFWVLTAKWQDRLIHLFKPKQFSNFCRRKKKKKISCSCTFQGALISVLSFIISSYVLNYYICCISVMCALKYCNFENIQSVHRFKSVISFSPLFRKLLTFKVYINVPLCICLSCVYGCVHVCIYVFFQLCRFCLVSEMAQHYGVWNKGNL